MQIKWTTVRTDAPEGLHVASGRWIGSGKVFGPHDIVRGMARFSEKWPSFTWSSGWSGSEMYVKCLQSIKQYSSKEFGIALCFPVKFAAENNADVLLWLTQQFSITELPLILRDVADMVKVKAANVRKLNSDSPNDFVP